MQRITIPEIKKHPWYLKNVPKELDEGEKTNYEETGLDKPVQSVEEIMRIIQEAITPGVGSKTGGEAIPGTSDPDDEDADIDYEVDMSGEFIAPF